MVGALHRTMRTRTVLASIAFLPACYDQSTQVMLRDPSQVAVTIEAPTGRQAVLVDGQSWPDQSYAEVPSTTPPFHSTPPFPKVASIPPAWLTRNRGGVVLQIDLARGTRSRPLVTADGRVDIQESAFGQGDGGLVLGASEVRMNLKEWWCDDGSDCIRRHQPSRRHLDLGLVTARSNVLSIRRVSSTDAGTGVVLTILGAALVGSGAWLWTWGDAPPPHAIGGALMGSGVVALAFATHFFLAPTHEAWLIAPPVEAQ
jgi:hypothetical protein